MGHCIQKMRYDTISVSYPPCEEHDCTTPIFEYLFRGSIPLELIEGLRESKEDRIEIQYYSRHVEVDLEEVIGKTGEFVLEVEKIIDGLNPGKIAVLEKTSRPR